MRQTKKIMPHSSEVAALAIRFRSAGGRRILVSEETAALVAHALETYADIAAHRRDDDFNPFLVEAWDEMEKFSEVIAKCCNAGIADAAFNCAIVERPKSIVTLRKGAHLMRRRRPSPADR
jgi:hypothetical protein